MTRASLAKDPSHVSSMFDEVAPRYDCTNDVLSMGQARLWRRAVTRTIAPRPGMRILDLGCGWGSLSLWMAETYPNAKITAVSNSHGQRRHHRRREYPDRCAEVRRRDQHRDGRYRHEAEAVV